MRQVLQVPLLPPQVWEEKDLLLYWAADLHYWVLISLYLLKEVKYICHNMLHTKKIIQQQSCGFSEPNTTGA